MRLKHVLRRLIGAPTFTIVTILTLAIGIGANTAIFSVIEGVLLKPLPYQQSDRLLAVRYVAPGITGVPVGMAPFLYFIDREQSKTLEDIALSSPDFVSVTGTENPERVEALEVTDGLLPILKVQPALGRLFTRADDQPDTPRTVMLSYGYWQRKFGGDPHVLGKNLIMDGRSQEIIGVLPRDFWYRDSKAELLQPLRLDRAKTHLGNFSYDGVARLRPGATEAQAQADLARLIPVAMDAFTPFPGMDRGLFDKARLGPDAQSLKQNVTGDIASVLWVLMGTIGMVLLIACANVANLLLVRAEGRQQELAIRAALGADWSQIVRELLFESVFLGVLGGAFGLALAVGGLRLLVTLAPSNLPRMSQISLDAPVLLFTFAISIAAGLLFGAIPAIKYAGPQLATALRGGGRSMSQSRERHSARNTLVVVQVALALVLLVCSGLMIRTFYALKQVEPGFTHPESAQTFRISIPEQQVPEQAKVIRMQQDIYDKLAAIPGVKSVGMTSLLPMSNSGWHDAIWAADRPQDEGKAPVLRVFTFVSPGWLSALGTSLVAGREYTWADALEKHNVAMVSENVARELWGSPAAALGKQIRADKNSPWREIVGVVADMRFEGANKKAPSVIVWPQMMEKFAGNPVFLAQSMTYVLRTDRAGSTALMDEARSAVWSVNSNLPVAAVHTMQWYVDQSMARTSFTLVMLGIAGAMALLLGVVGIYGVISYSVSQRRREIGIRMALGSPLRRLTNLFVAHGVRLASIGVLFGLAASLALSRVMKDLVFEVKPIDPMTYVAVSLGLVAAAMIASYIPALRAAKVNPVEALRAD